MIAKDRSGFKAQVLDTTIENSIPNAYSEIDVDGSPVVVVAAWINSTIDVSTEVQNTGTVAWPNQQNDSNHVGLYEDDEPMGLCPHSYGKRKEGNAFKSFEFPNGTFASIAGNPETGWRTLRREVSILDKVAPSILSSRSPVKRASTG